MKISTKRLSEIISEVMREQRDEPGRSHARSELSQARRGYPKKELQRRLNKAERRQGDREIRWALMDAEGDGDLDIVNMGEFNRLDSIPSRKELDQIENLLNSRGIIDDTNEHIFTYPRRYNDPRLGGHSPDLAINAFLAKLATDVAFGDETRLDAHDILRMRELSRLFDGVFEDSQLSIQDEMRRDEFMQENLNESRETQMSKGFSRNDIKEWFAQTLYEDFETSKPRRRRSNGVLTEATVDERDVKVDDYDEYLIMISNALVLGIEALFGRDLSEDDEYELGQDFRRELEDHPDLTNKLAKHFESFRMGSSHPEPSEAEYGSHIDFTAADRAEILDQVAATVYDTMDSGGLNAIELDRIVDAMIKANEIDEDHWHKSAIDVDEVRDRVVEIEEENTRFTGI